MSDDTTDALADLFRCGWTATDMRAAFPWLEDGATYDAWSTILVFEQIDILSSHGSEMTLREAVRTVVIPQEAA